MAKVDRLARNERDLLDIVQHREDIGASVTSTEQGISSEGPYGRFMLVMLGGIAELERGIISERHRRLGHRSLLRVATVLGSCRTGSTP